MNWRFWTWGRKPKLTAEKMKAHVDEHREFIDHSICDKCGLPRGDWKYHDPCRQPTVPFRDGCGLYYRKDGSVGNEHYDYISSIDSQKLARFLTEEDINHPPDCECKHDFPPSYIRYCDEDVSCGGHNVVPNCTKCNAPNYTHFPIKDCKPPDKLHWIEDESPAIVIKYTPIDPRKPWLRGLAWPQSSNMTMIGGELRMWSFKDCDPFADEHPYTD